MLYAIVKVAELKAKSKKPLPVLLCFSSLCCGPWADPRLRQERAESGELPGYPAGCGRVRGVAWSLEGALRRSSRSDLCGGLQWPAEDEGGQEGPGRPAEGAQSGRKTCISVITLCITLDICCDHHCSQWWSVSEKRSHYTCVCLVSGWQTNKIKWTLWSEVNWLRFCL